MINFIIFPRDLYAILGVKPTADDEDIRKAYRRAALKYHPDKQAGKSENEKETANAAFKEVSSAYEILSDREKRWSNYCHMNDQRILFRPLSQGKVRFWR